MDVLVPSHRRTNPEIFAIPHLGGFVSQKVILVCQVTGFHSNWKLKMGGDRVGLV